MRNPGFHPEYQNGGRKERREEEREEGRREREGGRREEGEKRKGAWERNAEDI